MSYKETVIWKYLKHPNILPLLGVTINPLQLISKLMPGGTLPDYIKKNPGADRLRLVGIHPAASFPCLFCSIAIRSRKWSPPSSLPQHYSQRHQRSTWSSEISLHRCIDTRLVKHPCGRLRSCTHRGFRRGYTRER